MKFIVTFRKLKTNSNIVYPVLVHGTIDEARACSVRVGDCELSELHSYHEIDIDPDAGMQSCDVTQLAADGRPQICVDREEIERAQSVNVP